MSTIQTKSFGGMKELLGQFVAKDDLHARWLNTLSFLEYTGSRKIFLTQDVLSMSEEMLRHAAEEARHAYSLKAMSSRLAPGQLPDYRSQYLLCGYSAYRYFQSLDIAVQRELAEVEDDRQFIMLCYLYVSHIIEERANWMYDLYSQVLAEKNQTVSLSAIMAEEERHLADTMRLLSARDRNYENRMQKLRTLEGVFFSRFYQTLNSFMEKQKS